MELGVPFRRGAWPSLLMDHLRSTPVPPDSETPWGSWESKVSRHADWSSPGVKRHGFHGDMRRQDRQSAGKALLHLSGDQVARDPVLGIHVR